MKTAQRDFQAASAASANATSTRKPARHKTPRNCPRVTLRLSPDDHAHLTEMANGMALATFIRAKVLDEQLPRRKRRSSTSVADTQAIAQILGLLGQSRIANNLNQLAYHANVGSLAMDETTQTPIEETHNHIILPAANIAQSTWDAGMILKGNQRANGRELGLHLLNVADNEHAVVHELRGFLADDLIGAFKETEAISLGTKCQQYLFSLSLNPPQLAIVSIEEFERVIGEIERRMGLTGQPRAMVFHEKKGRRHAHCVWSRINVDQMPAINLSHYKLRLRDISRELYQEHEWYMPAGLREAQNRDPLNYSAAEAGQAKRIKRDPAELKKLLKSCWDASDSRSAFANALSEHGFSLASGDRRGFVAVDAQGEVYSLSRWQG